MNNEEVNEYLGDSTLEDWLSLEVFPNKNVTAPIVFLFERWRSIIENHIQSWIDNGRVDWQNFGSGYFAIGDDDEEAFEDMLDMANDLIGRIGIDEEEE